MRLSPERKKVQGLSDAWAIIGCCPGNALIGRHAPMHWQRSTQYAIGGVFTFGQLLFCRIGGPISSWGGRLPSEGAHWRGCRPDLPCLHRGMVVAGLGSCPSFGGRLATCLFPDGRLATCSTFIAQAEATQSTRDNALVRK